MARPPGVRPDIAPLPKAAAPITASADPAELLSLMQQANFDGDVHLVGGQQTINAFRAIGALDDLGIVVMPILLGDGLPLTPAGAKPEPFQLVSSRTFPDGSIEHLYTRTD